MNDFDIYIANWFGLRYFIFTMDGPVDKNELEFEEISNIEQLVETATPDLSNDFPNIQKIKFSLALSPYSNDGFYRNKKNISILKNLAPHIYDIYFTYHLPPFMNNAHQVVMDKQLGEKHLMDMLFIQEKSGITVSPVFNDIYTSNHYDSLQLFIKGFSRLYEMGIRSCTIPHTLWMKFGLLQQEFPELVIKNTVLRHCFNGQDFWNFASAGFDMVNLDRRLMRNIDALTDIRDAQIAYEKEYGKKVVLSILTHEACRGDCALWSEHYQHNLTNPNPGDFHSAEMFNVPMKFSCQPSRWTASDHNWRAVHLPIIREDLERVLAYADVVKLPGRGSDQSIFYEQVNTILAYKYSTDPTINRNVQGQYFDTLLQYARHEIPDPSLVDAIELWRQKTRSCYFQCWKCDLCDQIKGLLYNIHHVDQYIDAVSNS